MDHFHIGQNAHKTYKQRYFINNNFVDSNKPVTVAILSIGGESAIGGAPGGNKDSYSIEGAVALEYNAPIYALEHRFYGTSQPFADDKEHTLSNEHLKLLSSR